ncbi:MAG: hypothetical protein QN123_14595, partial [Armatimonadota bacterium]|nr:hypothetical protein [Armatimonadota bacterium]
AGAENGETPRPMGLVADVVDQTPSRGEEAADGDLARGAGRGQFALRIGEATAWRPYAYAPGRSIAAGKAGWLAFIRNAPAREFAAAVEAMLADPALNGGRADA